MHTLLFKTRFKHATLVVSGSLVAPSFLAALRDDMYVGVLQEPLIFLGCLRCTRHEPTESGGNPVILSQVSGIGRDDVIVCDGHIPCQSNSTAACRLYT